MADRKTTNNYEKILMVTVHPEKFFENLITKRGTKADKETAPAVNGILNAIEFLSGEFEVTDEIRGKIGRILPIDENAEAINFAFNMNSIENRVRGFRIILTKYSDEIERTYVGYACDLVQDSKKFVVIKTLLSDVRKGDSVFRKKMIDEIAAFHNLNADTNASIIEELEVICDRVLDIFSACDTTLAALPLTTKNNAVKGDKKMSNIIDDIHKELEIEIDGGEDKIEMDAKQADDSIIFDVKPPKNTDKTELNSLGDEVAALDSEQMSSEGDSNSDSKKSFWQQIREHRNAKEDTLEDWRTEEDFAADLQVNKEHLKTYMLGIVLKLNGMSSEPFFGHGVNNVAVDVNGEEFKASSVFFNDKLVGEKFDLGSIQYRARFVSLMFLELVRKMDSILDMMYEITEVSEGDPGENETRYNHLRHLAKEIVTFATQFCKKGNTVSSLDPLVSWFLLASKRKFSKKEEVYNNFIGNLDVLKNGYRSAEDPNLVLTECDRIDYVLKLTYLQITGSFEGIEFEYPDDGSITADVLKTCVRDLGKYLLDFKKSGGNISSMYNVFTKASPYLYFKYNDIGDDKELNAGCRALAYFSFIVNNKYVTRVVKDLCA